MVKIKVHAYDIVTKDDATNREGDEHTELVLIRSLNHVFFESEIFPSFVKSNFLPW